MSWIKNEKSTKNKHFSKLINIIPLNFVKNRNSNIKFVENMLKYMYKQEEVEK